MRVKSDSEQGDWQLGILIMKFNPRAQWSLWPQGIDFFLGGGGITATQLKAWCRLHLCRILYGKIPLYFVKWFLASYNDEKNDLVTNAQSHVFIFIAIADNICVLCFNFCHGINIEID
jgi:hypothetical protein